MKRLSSQWTIDACFSWTALPHVAKNHQSHAVGSHILGKSGWAKLSWTSLLPSSSLTKIHSLHPPCFPLAAYHLFAVFEKTTCHSPLLSLGSRHWAQRSPILSVKILRVWVLLSHAFLRSVPSYFQLFKWILQSRGVLEWGSSLAVSQGICRNDTLED